MRARAISDPRGFLARGDPLILDEVQRAPEPLSYVQGLVDEDDRPGRFIVTGSQNILLMKSVSQTLAGRTALLLLPPFSLAELHGLPPLNPRELDRHGGAPASAAERLAGLDPWETLVTGFYPPVHDRGLSSGEWMSDYFRTYVERDLREVAQVLDLRAFENFVRLAAARTATELNLSGLAGDAGVTQQTARRWLTALEIGYIATTLPPHHANYRKRLRKRPRLHFLDTGMVCYPLGIEDAETLERHPLRGAVFESFVVAELVKAFAARRRDPKLHFWRDATGHEIDSLEPESWWRAGPRRGATWAVARHGFLAITHGREFRRPRPRCPYVSIRANNSSSLSQSMIASATSANRSGSEVSSRTRDSRLALRAPNFLVARRPTSARPSSARPSARPCSRPFSIPSR